MTEAIDTNVITTQRSQRRVHMCVINIRQMLPLYRVVGLNFVHCDTDFTDRIILWLN